MEHWEKKANGWVFLSHSSKDYEDVKIVRNYLEENGFSALMFYLKCLEDKDKRDKAQQLIKWEIESRNIFVFCNSESAKLSKWVQYEIRYVEKFPEKIYKEINIDKLKYQKCTQLSKLDDLMNKATLFFSYSMKDEKVVTQVYDYLVSFGFKIWIASKSIQFGDNITDRISEGLKEASQSGVILVFISKKSLKSKWVSAEIRTAIASNTVVIPLLIEHIDINELPIYLRNILYLNIAIGNFEENMKKLLEAIKNISP